MESDKKVCKECFVHNGDTHIINICQGSCSKTSESKSFDIYKTITALMQSVMFLSTLITVVAQIVHYLQQ